MSEKTNIKPPHSVSSKKHETLTSSESSSTEGKSIVCSNAESQKSTTVPNVLAISKGDMQTTPQTVSTKKHATIEKNKLWIFCTFAN